MSFNPGAIAGSNAAMIAAQQAQRQAAEEERMAGYRPEDLDGWEFKILRTAGSDFKRPEPLKEILAEEARAGWELLEKFDDQRLRLKRRTRARDRDHQLDFDPYRTWVGLTPGVLAIRVLLVVVGGMGIVVGLAAYFR